MAESLKEHEKIAEAILSGKGDEAQKLLHDHVAVQGERFADFLASLRMIRNATPEH